MKYAIIFLLTLTAAAEDSAQPNFAAEFAKRWTTTRSLAVGVAEAMPPHEYAFKPDPPSMSFGEQIAHTAWGNYAFCSALKDEKIPTQPEPKEKPEIVKYIADSFDYCSKQIASVTPQQMNAIHSTPDGRMTGRETLLSLYVHMAHHRGQAEIYLRIKGIAPPSYVF